jgi:mono/diheme cytochrome c family protein
MRMRTLATCLSLAALMGVSAPLVMSAEPQASPGVDGHDKVVRKMSSAKSLYMLKCSGCHRVDGTGAPEAGIPPFPGFIAPLARNADGRVYIAHVPGIMGSRLSNEQLADVLNYVIDEWAGEDASSTPRFTVEELAALREVPVTNIVEYRRDVVNQLIEAGDPVADYPWP